MVTQFPPVVSVLGHVDHGKTTLLDAIRKSNIASREHGGITQKIGASSVEIVHEGQKRRITFIDTPGHEAFTHMRGRGAKVADIGILVVAANDGVMPQTKESIQLLKHAQIPFIVAFTKADLPEAQIEKVKQQLLREEVIIDSMGGEIPSIQVSAKTGQNVKELLDLILLVQELNSGGSENVSSSNPFQAVVIESKLDPKSGPKATIVVKNGTLSVKDEIVAGEVDGKVRALITDTGAQVPAVTVGDAVEVLGFTKVPQVGSVVAKKNEGATAAQTVLQTKKRQENQEGKLSLILVTDTQGGLEAITASLPEGVNVILSKTGDVSEADVLLAKSVGAIILTFNIKLKPEVVKFAITEKILVKNYTIIYELLDELQDVLEGKKLAEMEQIYGVAQIQASFPFEKTQVLGVKVAEGRIAKGDKVRLLRGDIVIGETSIVSLRQGKETASKVEKGQEAGLLISPFLDFRVGDMIISHS